MTPQGVLAVLVEGLGSAAASARPPAALVAVGRKVVIGRLIYDW